MDNNPPEMPSEAPVVGEALDPDYEIRDREYTEKLLEKVAPCTADVIIAHVILAGRTSISKCASSSRWDRQELVTSPDSIAERFNIPFTEPRLDVILTKTEFRK